MATEDKIQEDNNLTKIDHTVVMVANLEESISWYLTSFKCILLHQGRTLAVLKFANMNIVLSLPSEQRPHLGILKDDAEKFGEISEQSDLCASTFISDPSGNPVELVKRTFKKINTELNNS